MPWLSQARHDELLQAEKKLVKITADRIKYGRKLDGVHVRMMALGKGLVHTTIIGPDSNEVIIPFDAIITGAMVDVFIQNGNVIKIAPTK